MKINIIVSRVYLSILLVFTCQQVVTSQENGISGRNNKGWFLGASIGQSESQINISAKYLPGIKSVKSNMMPFSFDLGYFISKYIGLTTGLVYDSHKCQLKIDSYQNQYSAIDSENENFEMQVTGSHIQESQKIDLIGIPGCIIIRMPFKKSIGIYLQGGGSVSLPLKSKYITNGVFTYKGYFPTYNVILENIPEYGFSSNVNCETSGKLDMSPLIFGVMASVGIDYTIQNKIQFSFSACFNKSINNLTSYSSLENYQLINGLYQINSFTGGSPSTLQSVSFKIGLRYFIKKVNKYDKPTDYLKKYGKREKIYLN